jgi:hypothetical protein
MKTSKQHVWAGIAALVFVSGCSTLASRAPPVWEGLELRPAKGLDIVYLRPNVDFAQYRKLQLEPVAVAFEKRWQDDQARSRNLASQIDAGDMRKIRNTLSDMVRAGLSSELTRNGYSIVDTGGADTLQVTATVVDLYINAPEVATASMVRTYTTSAGSMTLVLEARDAPSGQLLARVVDQHVDDKGQMTWTDAASNRNDAQFAINIWAKRLREGLDRVTGRK